MKSLTDIVLDAYREGVFPMADSAEDDNFAFYKPYMRGLIPIAGLHIPSKLLKTLRQKDYSVTADRAYREIIDGCAAHTKKRENTWINRPIRDLFINLHRDGHAHSIEVWNKEGELAGGLYGLSLGAVFCGESMVSFEKDASKIALCYLCALLWRCGYTVLDTQFINPHLVQFGAYEIPQEEYEKLLQTETKRVVKDFREFNLDGDLLENYLQQRGEALS